MVRMNSLQLKDIMFSSFEDCWKNKDLKPFFNENKTKPFGKKISLYITCLTKILETKEKDEYRKNAKRQLKNKIFKLVSCDPVKAKKVISKVSSNSKLSVKTMLNKINQIINKKIFLTTGDIESLITDIEVRHKDSQVEKIISLLIFFPNPFLPPPHIKENVKVL